MGLPVQAMLGAQAVQVLRVRDFDHSRSLVPHRHRFYMILWVTEGIGKHRIDFKEYDFKPGRVFMMVPGQVHEMIHPVADGFMLIFEEAFGQELCNGAVFRDLDEEEQLEYQLLWDIFLKRQQADTVFVRQLVKTLWCFAAQAAKDTDLEDRSIVDRLKKLIEKNYREHQDRLYYCQQLRLPVWKLNEICKAAEGTSVHVLINERIILEAKTLLRTTRRSMKEIAFELGFQDPSYFGRTFKNHTGQTPLDYRGSCR